MVFLLSTEVWLSLIRRGRSVSAEMVWMMLLTSWLVAVRGTPLRRTCWTTRWAPTSPHCCTWTMMVSEAIRNTWYHSMSRNKASCTNNKNSRCSTQRRNINIYKLKQKWKPLLPLTYVYLFPVAVSNITCLFIAMSAALLVTFICISFSIYSISYPGKQCCAERQASYPLEQKNPRIAGTAAQECQENAFLASRLFSASNPACSVERRGRSKLSTDINSRSRFKPFKSTQRTNNTPRTTARECDFSLQQPLQFPSVSFCQVSFKCILLVAL